MWHSLLKKVLPPLAGLLWGAAGVYVHLEVPSLPERPADVEVTRAAVKALVGYSPPVAFAAFDLAQKAQRFRARADEFVVRALTPRDCDPFPPLD
jgi:hypothetical protein